MSRETSEGRENETGGSERSNDPRKMSVRIGEATTIRLSSSSGATDPGCPGPMSLVVAGTVLRDQLSGQSEQRSMRDNDRPVLHAELRLDGCLKPDGKLCPLKSLNILVHDDEGVSQPRSPGSPQRTISVVMSDGSKISDAGKQSPGMSGGGRMQFQNENGRDGDVGKQQQFVYRSPNILLEEPFNVHRYQTRMLGDQPQGLAAALTEERPELLPPFKAPQGLATVLLFDSSADEFYPEHETTEGRNDISSENCKHEFRSVGEGESISNDKEDSMRSMSLEQAEMPSDNLQSGEEGKHFSSQGFDISSSTASTSPWRHGSGKSENLHILQSLPHEVVSSLVSGHSKRLSVGYEGGGRGSPAKYSHGESQRSKDRSMNFEGEHRHHKRHSRNTEGTPQDSGSSTYTGYFSSNSRANGSSRHEGRASQRTSRKFLDGGNEQLEVGYEGRSSPRRSKRHSRDSHSSPGSSYTSYFTNSNSRGSGSFQHEGRGRQRSSRKLLEGVSEEHEVSYDNQVPLPPAPPLSGESENTKDQRRRTLKASQREPGGSVSFRSSDVSGDDRRSYGSTHQTKSQTGSFLGPTPSDRTRDPTGPASSKPLQSEDRMASISKLLDNMSSITQLLSSIPQQVGGNEPWIQQSSHDIQGASNMNRSSQQYLSNNGPWQFDHVNKGHSQLLIEGGPQTNPMPYDGSQPNQFMAGGPSQPSTSENLPSQYENTQDGQLNRPSQMHSMNSQESQLQTNRLSLLNMQGGDSHQFQNMDNRSSQLMNGISSQMNIQDTSLQQFDALNNRPSQVLNGRPSQVLGTMNRSSQLNVQDDGSPQVDNMIRQPSQLPTNRMSQQNMPGGNSQQIFPMENRPSQSLKNTPSQLNIPNDGSQLFPNRPSQLNMQGNEEFPTMDNRASQTLDSRPSQLAMKTQDGVFPQLDTMNRQSSQMLTNRLSQQQNMQGDNFQPFLHSDSRPLQILHGRPSQIDLQGTDVQQVGPMNNHSSQFQNTRLSQMEMQIAGSRILSSLTVRPSQINIQATGPQLLDSMNRQPSQLQKNSLLQLNMQGLQDSQQFQSMDNRPSQLVNTRPSQMGTQDTNLQQFDGMNGRPSQLDQRNDRSRMVGSMNNRVSQLNMQGSDMQDIQQFDPMNSRPFQVLNTRPSQINMHGDELQKVDTMNNRASQLLTARASQSGILQNDDIQQYDPMNARPSQLLNTRPSQINPQGDGPQQFDPMTSRPSQSGMLDDRLQQFDTLNPRPSQQLLNNRPSQMNMRPSQLVNTRPSQIGMQGDEFQQFDPMNPRPSQIPDTRQSQIHMGPSQLLNTRPSQFNMQDDGLQQFDPMNVRPSQLLNTRPSQTVLLYDDPQQFDPMNPRPSQLMNTRPSQFGVQDDALLQFDPMNPRQSQLMNSRPSQFNMQDDGTQPFDPMNPRHSQFMNTRPSQIGVQDDDLQEYDNMEPRPSYLLGSRQSQMNLRPSQLLNTRPSQLNMQDDGLQHFDPMNPRPSQFLNTRPSQLDMQDDGLQQFDSMNPRPSQHAYANTRPSQINLQESNIQQFDTMNVRPSQLSNSNGLSQQIMQDDGSQLLQNRPSQVLNRGPSQFDIQNRPSQLANYRPSQLSSGRPSQVPNQGPSNTQPLKRASGRQISQSTALCDNCSDPSHDALNCPIQVCFKCREPGHYARDCLKPVAGQGTSDPAMLQQKDMTQQWDEGVMESENAAQIGDSPQGHQSMGTWSSRARQSTHNHPNSNNTQWYQGAESRRTLNQQIPGSYDDTLQQLGLLDSQNLRRSLARTVSTMLEEVQELETRSRESSLAHARNTKAGQSGGGLRSSQLADNKPQHSNHENGKPKHSRAITMRGSSQLFGNMPHKSRQNSRVNQSRQTPRSSQLLKDVSRQTEEYIRNSRTSEWLSNLPTQYEMTDVNGSQHSQDLEQYAQLSEVDYNQNMPEDSPNGSNHGNVPQDMEQYSE